MHEVVLDRTVSLREVSQMDVDDKQDWISLSQAFYDVLDEFRKKIDDISRRSTTLSQGERIVINTGNPGRPESVAHCVQVILLFYDKIRKLEKAVF